MRLIMVSLLLRVQVSVEGCDHAPFCAPRRARSRSRPWAAGLCPYICWPATHGRSKELLHLRHAHGGHRGHDERDGYLRIGDRLAIRRRSGLRGNVVVFAGLQRIVVGVEVELGLRVSAGAGEEAGGPCCAAGKLFRSAVEPDIPELRWACESIRKLPLSTTLSPSARPLDTGNRSSVGAPTAHFARLEDAVGRAR
jgi:hypothetical protein